MLSLLLNASPTEVWNQSFYFFFFLYSLISKEVDYSHHDEMYSFQVFLFEETILFNKMMLSIMRKQRHIGIIF